MCMDRVWGVKGREYILKEVQGEYGVNAMSVSQEGLVCKSPVIHLMWLISTPTSRDKDTQGMHWEHAKRVMQIHREGTVRFCSHLEIR